MGPFGYIESLEECIIYDMSDPRQYHVLNLGGGVQSTAMLLMQHDGALQYPLDCAIYADTGWDPQAVTDLIDVLRSIVSCPIHIARAKGLNIRERALEGAKAQMPLHGRTPNGTRTMLTRRCTLDMKVRPVEVKIRSLLGVTRITRHSHTVHQYYGISLDEFQRMSSPHNQYQRNHYPLVDARLTRDDCIDYLRTHYPDLKVGKSACLGCPYKLAYQWLELDEDERADVIEVDEAIRHWQRSGTTKSYLHRSGIPLRQVYANADAQPSLFEDDANCESGYCMT